MTNTTAARTFPTLADAMTAREARMGTAIEDAAALGHLQTVTDGPEHPNARIITCTCGDESSTTARAVRVVMDIHAREVLGTLAIPTVG